MDRRQSFFVLSGFLITSILLESRGKPRYFRNFYGRRALRIWPVYVLVLLVCYLNAPWFIGPSISVAFRTAPWWAYILFLQNLFHLSLPPSIGPTWSLAIEEQYYFLWAPLVRFLRRPWMLAVLLTGALVGSPLFRLTHFAWITQTHTLTHIDGIAMGSLLALGLYTLPLSRRTWLILGLVAIPTGFLAAATIAGGTAFLDSALTTGFAGSVLAAISSTGARNPLNAVLCRGPLAFYGRISYGLYMTHIMIFVYFRLVRCKDGSIRNDRQPRGRCIQARGLHSGGQRALVPIRVANSQAQAILLTPRMHPSSHAVSHREPSYRGHVTPITLRCNIRLLAFSVTGTCLRHAHE